MYIFSREVLKEVPGPPQGCPEVAPGRPQGGPGGRDGRPWRARGGARLDHEAHGRCWAAHGPFGLTFSYVFVPLDALSLRFPMNLGHRTLSLGACAVKSPKAELRTTHGGAFSWRLGPGREPLRRVQGPLLLIPDTCYLILDIRHLILDT